LRTDTLDPTATLDITDALDPIFAIPFDENVEPIQTSLVTETKPPVTTFTADPDDPKQLALDTERVLPNALPVDVDEKNEVPSATETDDPKNAEHLPERFPASRMVEPTLKLPRSEIMAKLFKDVTPEAVKLPEVDSGPPKIPSARTLVPLQQRKDPEAEIPESVPRVRRIDTEPCTNWSAPNESCPLMQASWLVETTPETVSSPIRDKPEPTTILSVVERLESTYPDPLIEIVSPR